MATVNLGLVNLCIYLCSIATSSYASTVPHSRSGGCNIAEYPGVCNITSDPCACCLKMRLRDFADCESPNSNTDYLHGADFRQVMTNLLQLKPDFLQEAEGKISLSNPGSMPQLRIFDLLLLIIEKKAKMLNGPYNYVESSTDNSTQKWLFFQAPKCSSSPSTDIPTSCSSILTDPGEYNLVLSRNCTGNDALDMRPGICVETNEYLFGSRCQRFLASPDGPKRFCAFLLSTRLFPSLPEKIQSPITTQTIQLSVNSFAISLSKESENFTDSGTSDSMEAVEPLLTIAVQPEYLQGWFDPEIQFPKYVYIFLCLRLDERTYQWDNASCKCKTKTLTGKLFKCACDRDGIFRFARIQTESLNFSSSYVSTNASLIDNPIIIGLLLPVAVVLLIIISILFVCAKKRRISKRLPDDTIPFHELLDPSDLPNERSLTAKDKFQSLYSRYAKFLEVEIKTLEISNKILGRGQFGTVYKGIARSLPTVSRGPTVVAVKVLSGSADSEQQTMFAEEIRMMLKCGPHVNIVNILGVVSQGKSLVILEYCPFGTLSSYLKNRSNGHLYIHVDESGNLLPFNEEDMRHQWLTLCRREGRQSDVENMKDHMLSTSDLIKFSHQISRGMEYLSGRFIIHRDLAARNVLVADNQVMKISDFGLAKQEKLTYTMSNILIPLPILWMPPEAILEREFSQKSDVWSFGILLWEIFSMGKMPFESSDVEKFTGNNFAKWLIEGNQMAKPDSAPFHVYIMMQHCWSLDREKRPIFADLQKSLDDLICSCSTEASIYLTINQEETVSKFDELDKEILNCLVEASEVGDSLSC